MASALADALSHLHSLDGPPPAAHRPAPWSDATVGWQTQLVAGLAAAGMGGDRTRPLDLARDWGRVVALGGQGIDEAVAAIWDASSEVGRRLASQPEERPGEIQAALAEWERLSVDAVVALLQGYATAREEKQAKEREELLWQVAHDGLTGLYNQRFFGVRLEEEFARAQRYGHPLSVVMPSRMVVGGIRDHPSDSLTR